MDIPFLYYVCDKIKNVKDIKKNTFLLLCITAFFLQNIYASTSIGIPVDIYVSFNDSYKEKGHIMRVPPQIPDVYIKDHLITFDAFGNACTLELKDAESDKVVYSQTIPTGTASCTLPSTLEGYYLIQFVCGNLVYWGYINL